MIRTASYIVIGVGGFLAGRYLQGVEVDFSKVKNIFKKESSSESEPKEG